MRSLFKACLVITLLLGFSAISRAQLITSLTPNSGIPGQTVDIVIRGVGTHFQNNKSAADLGAGMTVLKLNVQNQVTATATVKIEPSAGLGFRTVKITTGEEIAEMDDAFEVFTGQGNFRANIELMPIETISLNDVDLTQPKSTPILFFINVYNDDQVRKVKLSVHLISQSNGLIGKLTSPARSLNAGSVSRFTNRDLTNIDLNSGTGQAFVQHVRALGTFPPDNYTYKLVVTDEQGNVIAEDEDVNVVTNFVANPELILPGAGFDRPLEQVYNQFPLFQWFGQMDKFDFALYELRDGQTPEEAVRNIAVFKQNDIAGTSFLYPNYAEKLISGKLYAWQVKGKIASAKGTQYLPSDVFRFMFVNPAEGPDPLLISKIEIAPSELDVNPGEQMQFTATFFDKDNNLIPNIKPEWKLVPAKGTINQNGLFVAGNMPGPLAVVVKTGNLTEMAVINVRMKALPGMGSWIAKDMLKQLFGVQ